MLAAAQKTSRARRFSPGQAALQAGPNDSREIRHERTVDRHRRRPGHRRRDPVRPHQGPQHRLYRGIPRKDRRRRARGARRAGRRNGDRRGARRAQVPLRLRDHHRRDRTDPRRHHRRRRGARLRRRNRRGPARHRHDDGALSRRRSHSGAAADGARSGRGRAYRQCGLERPRLPHRQRLRAGRRADGHAGDARCRGQVDEDRRGDDRRDDRGRRRSPKGATATRLARSPRRIRPSRSAPTRRSRTDGSTTRSSCAARSRKRSRRPARRSRRCWLRCGATAGRC